MASKAMPTMLWRWRACAPMREACGKRPGTPSCNANRSRLMGAPAAPALNAQSRRLKSELQEQHLMAKRGPKPTATVVKLVRGNPGRRPLPVGEPMPEGRPKPPTPLSGRPLALWRAYVSPAWWLTRADSVMCLVFVQLAAEFEAYPHTMLSARISNLRACASSLGFEGPGSRARFGSPPEGGDPASRYFD